MTYGYASDGIIASGAANASVYSDAVITHGEVAAFRHHQILTLNVSRQRFAPLRGHVGAGSS